MTESVLPARLKLQVRSLDPWKGESEGETIAASLGGAMDSVIERDMEEARTAGVRGTPTFFINGRKYQNPGRSADDIAKVIDKLLVSR